MRVREDEPGQRDLLGLRGGERPAARADLGVQALVEAPGPDLRVHRRERRPQLGVGRPGPGQEQVVPERAHEDVVLLVDQGHVLADPLRGHPRELGGTEGDRAGARGVDAREQPPEGGLAGARRADQGDPGAGRHLQGHLVQHVDALAVAEPDLVRAHGPALRPYLRVARVRLDVPDADEPGQRHLRDLELVVPPEHDPDRVDQHLREQRARGQLPHVDPALEHEHPAEQEHRAQHRRVGDVDDGEENRAQEEGVPLPRDPFGDPPVRQRDPPRAEAVRLDGAARVDRLGEGPGHRRVPRRLRAVRRGRPPEVPAAAHDQQRSREQRGQRERRGRDREAAEQQSRPHEADGQLGHGLAHGVGEPVDVRGDPGEQIARARPLQDARRQPDRADQEVLPQVGEHLLAEHRAAQPDHPYEDGLDEQRGREQADRALQMELPRTRGQLVHHRTEQVRAGHRGDHGDRVHPDEQRERPAVAAQQRPHIGADGRVRGDGQRRRRRRGRRVVLRCRQADHADSPSSASSSPTGPSPSTASARGRAAASSSSVSRVTTAR